MGEETMHSSEESSSPRYGGTAKRRLAALLDHDEEGESSGSGHGDRAMETTDFVEVTVEQAEEEAQRRARFDAILRKGVQFWKHEADVDEVRRGMVTLIKELVGFGERHQRTGTAEGNETEMEEARAIYEPDGDEAATLDTKESNSMHERARYIPLRLTLLERKRLRLVEAALNVSEYTDKVDVYSAGRFRANEKKHAQLKDICAILSGLLLASDFSKGQRLLKDRDFAEYKEFFQDAFEIARRHKIANPEKMRSDYGKLIHLLQDSVDEDVEDMLGFSCVKDLVTVLRFLEERRGADLLADPLIEVATKEILPDGKSRMVIQREIREKERAVEQIARRYSNSDLGAEDIRQCLYSIGDNNAYLRCARDPCEEMIRYLKLLFAPDGKAPGPDRSLAIMGGQGGARLTHDHSRQYQYVLQTLVLWREVTQNMYKLWCLAEEDLLSPSSRYSLRNTGQGLNRVQPAPRVGRAMTQILSSVQREIGNWVGSSVIHLGDHNVPNALTFIDKYAQIQRILLPLCTTIRRIAEVHEDRHAQKYINERFGGLEHARRFILRDFFRHAFDGSGADNFFDAGSCIDGRLTSAWNWCSLIEKKKYFHLFQLAGFSGFDGHF